MPSDPVIIFIGIYPEKMTKNVDKRFNCKSVHCSTVAKKWIPPKYPIIENVLSTLWHNEIPCSHLENIIKVTLMTLGDEYVTFWMPKSVHTKKSIGN